jgi:integrase
MTGLGYPELKQIGTHRNRAARQNCQATTKPKAGGYWEKQRELLEGASVQTRQQPWRRIAAFFNAASVQMQAHELRPRDLEPRSGCIARGGHLLRSVESWNRGRAGKASSEKKGGCFYSWLLDRSGAAGFRYHSKIDPSILLSKAQKDLGKKHPETFKILLLALGAGLRRGEIDRLIWRQINLDVGEIHIQVTEAGALICTIF